MSTPLYDSIKKYIDKKAVRFHTAGHSGIGSSDQIFDACGWDVTELSFSDNLQNPSGVILQAERLMADAYGAENCLFFTSGATSCIFCSLAVLKEYGKKILLVGEAHKSFYNGCELFGLEISELPFDDKTKLVFEAQLQSAAGFFITSPDYFGKTKDIVWFCEIARKNGKISIVDEAHGSHFAFGEGLPKGACSCADFTAESLHKTLPVYTGGAVLNVRENAHYQKALYWRQKLISTSPSYLIMASMDKARQIMCNDGKAAFIKVLKAVNSAKIGIHILGFSLYLNDDFTRLVIDNVDGYLVAALLESHGIYAELSTSDKIVFIVTPYNYTNLDALVLALGEIKKSNPKCVYVREKSALSEAAVPTNATVKKAKISAKAATRHEVCVLEKCVGKTLAADIGIYPPGIPQLFAGQILSEGDAKFILENKSRLFGLVNGGIMVYCES